MNMNSNKYGAIPRRCPTRSSGRAQDHAPGPALVHWLFDNNLLTFNHSCIGQKTSYTSIHEQSKGEKANAKDSKTHQPTLEVLQGLPLTRQNLLVELTTSCNQVVHLLSQCHACGLQDSLFKVHTVVNRTLARVYRFCQRQDPESNNNVLSMIQKIADEPSDLAELGCPLSLLVCTWVTCLLLRRDFNKSIPVLKLASQFLEQSQDLEKSDIASDSPTEMEVLDSESDRQTPADASFICRGVIRFLEACALCQAGDWSKCVSVIRGNAAIFPLELHGQSQYIEAYCLYHRGDFSSAMATGRALLQMLSPDEAASSECHNLIGCCLSKLGKHHMAIQQFRNALATSCSTIHAPSLYNISLLYRELGMEDAELESLKLLVTAFESNDKEENKEVVTILGPAVTLNASFRQQPASGHVAHQMQAIGHISLLYTLAKRCLDLKRNDTAADRFLDLLSILEGSPFIMDQRSSKCPSLLPSIHTIYLEAATALLRVDKLQEAMAVCDKLLSKSKLLQHQGEDLSPESVYESQDESETYDNRTMVESSGAVSRMHVGTRDKNSRADVHVGKTTSELVEVGKASTSTMLVTGNDIFDSGKSLSGNSRKRQRESSDGADSRLQEQGMRGGDVRRGWSSENKEIELEKLYTSHALMLQAECLRKQNDDTQALELFNHSLDILQTCYAREMEVSGSTGGGDDDKTNLRNEGEEKNRAKRRRIQADTSETSSHTMTQPVNKDSPPITSAVRELKSRAYNNRATILIGQNKLQDAMQDVLLSIQCSPRNSDAMRNHALLLEKLGRKGEAAAAWSELKEVKSNDTALHYK